MRICRHLWLVLPLGALACRSHPFGEIDRANALAHVDQAEADLRAGEFERALEHLSAVHEVGGLDADLRAREQRLVDEAARARFAELENAPSEELEELFDSELPDRVRARAAVLAAERMLAEDSRISAFRLIKKLDEKIPGHPERIAAGDLVARAGLSLIADDRSYNLLFHYKPRGIQALEYLVIQYPLEPRCPQAYFELSRAYEEDRDLDLAIDRSEDLLLYHPSSVYAPGASARLPYLRLCRLARDDYDRGELLRARAELESWLGRYPGHELYAWVGDLLQDCKTRLVRSDLYLAKYYERTQVPAGQRMHAERAAELALAAGLTEEAEEARVLLANLATPDPTARQDLPPTGPTAVIPPEPR